MILDFLWIAKINNQSEVNFIPLTENKNLKLVSRIPPKFFVVVLNLFFNYNL